MTTPPTLPTLQHPQRKKLKCGHYAGFSREACHTGSILQIGDNYLPSGKQLPQAQRFPVWTPATLEKTTFLSTLHRCKIMTRSLL
uniref:NAC transcription factors 93 n=1 Tax=Rhizophora mucronata TaxID=61149 RepID=A0A2P2IZ88_RHIMU